MPSLLLFATTTGYQTRAFGEAAGKLGVRLVLATDRCDQLDDPWRDQAVAVRFHDDARSEQAVLDALGDVAPAGILAVGDRPAVLAARVARALGLEWHSPEAAAASRNKLDSRHALARAGLPVPWFRTFPASTDPHDAARTVPYPCVVKPLAQSGSRGVIRANTPSEFADAFARVGALLKQADVRAERDPANDTLLVERFIPGREIAIEGLMEHGRLHLLAVFDKPDPLDGPFFEETIYVTPSTLAPGTQERIGDEVSSAARALGLHHGPIHAESRVSPAGVFVLEVGARPIGGLCSRALRFVRPDSNLDSISLEEVLLRHALGESIAGVAREPRASGVMMIPIPRRGIYRGVDGVDTARAVPSVEDVVITMKSGTLLVPLPEGKSYLGFIFARAETSHQVVTALRGAHERLAFRIERALM